MMKSRWPRLGWVILVTCCAGCGTYLRNRGNDALDMWDFGLSVSSKPGLAFLPADYMNVTPIGFSDSTWSPRAKASTATGGWK